MRRACWIERMPDLFQRVGERARRPRGLEQAKARRFTRVQVCTCEDAAFPATGHRIIGWVREGGGR